MKERMYAGAAGFKNDPQTIGREGQIERTVAGSAGAILGRNKPFPEAGVGGLSNGIYIVRTPEKTYLAFVGYVPRKTEVTGIKLVERENYGE